MSKTGDTFLDVLEVVVCLRREVIFQTCWKEWYVYDGRYIFRRAGECGTLLDVLEGVVYVCDGRYILRRDRGCGIIMFTTEGTLLDVMEGVVWLGGPTFYT